MDVEGKYWVLIEEETFDPSSTPQLELKDGVATWSNGKLEPGTYDAKGETIVISFDTPATPGFNAGRQVIACASIGTDYLSGDMIDSLNKVDAVEDITLSQAVVLIWVGGVSEAQVADAERDAGISWAELQEMEDLVGEVESRARH